MKLTHRQVSEIIIEMGESRFAPTNSRLAAQEM